MASSQPLKGILKKPAPPSSVAGDSDDDAATTPPRLAATHSRRLRSEQDAAEIARKHADILQQRRDLEAAIFQSIEKLTDFPLVRDEEGVSAAHPALQDSEEFLQLVRIFQPSDYDDLIEERNTCGHCGYALCPRPRQTYEGRGTWKLVNAGRKDFGIVQKSELEKWCSAACARRALYIKVQLNETAAWERIGIPDLQVELLTEPGEKRQTQAEKKKQQQQQEDQKQKRTKVENDQRQKDKDEQEQKDKDKRAEAQLSQDLARLKLNEERRLAQNAQALAMERGDATVDGGSGLMDIDDNGQPPRIVPPAPSALVDISIMEKEVTIAPTAPTLGTAGQEGGKGGDSDSHMLVEGHKIKFAGE